MKDRKEESKVPEDYTNEELLALYQKTGEPELKKELALRYLYIVKSIAIQMRDVYAGFTQMEDIVNEGVLMLMAAIDKFDEGKNAKFETYASRRIRGMIIDIARKQDWVPRTLRKSLRDINEESLKFYSGHGRYPTVEELAERLEMEPQKIRSVMGKANLSSVLSLDMVLEETGEQYKAIQIPSDKREDQPEENFLEQEFKSTLAEGIRSLKEKEQIVISLYYIEELNMKQIASIINVSEPRVSQIHAAAVLKLREYMENCSRVEEKEVSYVSRII
ncbi:sigma-70 family RNA polymerase sigma factor [Muricomes intestini]|jgi:RNA polymerase sigma factor for flagellar operon FliA|uniref:RNA polymerase sigma factor for flagellar operon FliA n=1 Tax=Muricomes intestini TaxID=1796634 RepID=A0A4R3KH54_9FIRM|nr:FliA/WhiG family RNA polymerase sigma factor [Muricomes intestini]TCS82792.1 RNA polymerase sigma factor for flagellar operon FliA [Muricomes intestini]HAX51244.1 FliA/WhiG family RNA polymerase sigma factor [Lachnospiraceae bacterium]HCR83301.1 FliA/WhiG family RNA polymerase sigma factor [Lachnospiraceae bacterium]